MIRRARRRALLACLWLAGAPALAWQSDGDKLQPPELEGYRRWGILRARPGIELSNFGYDSNILYNTTGATVSDYTATLSPRLEGLVLFGSRGFVTFTERFDYTAYLENGSQNYWNNSFTTRGTLPFRRFGVFAEWTFEDLRLRPLDQEDTRAQSKRRERGAGLILQPGWRTEIEVGHFVDTHRLRDEEGTPIGQRLNRDEKRTELELAYRLRGRTRALVWLEDRSVDFQSPFDTGTALVQRDTREDRWLTGVELGRGASLVGRALVGWTRIDARDPALDDLSEAAAEVDVTWFAGSRTRVRLEAARKAGFAVSGGNAYYLDTHASLRTVHYFTTLVGGEVAYRKGTLDFPASTVTTAREDDVERYSLGLRLRLFRGADGRRVEYSAAIGRYERDSTLPGFDQRQTTFSLGAVLGF